MMKLSKHFLERWAERVGELDPAIILQWVEDAPVVQRYRVCTSIKGHRMTILELRLLPEIGAVVKLDASSNTLVTVVTREAM